jgi:lysozyme family protein
MYKEYDDNFIYVFSLMMENEKGYSNHPEDKGGETWDGISRKNNPDWEGWSIIDDLKHKINPETDRLLFEANLRGNDRLSEFTMYFYYQKYYLPLNLGKISEVRIVSELFDTAVNQGVNSAADYFQKALNRLNDNQRLFPDLKLDSSIGEKTLAAYNSYVKTSEKRGYDRVINTLIKCLNGYQFIRYDKICEMNPTQEIFFFGWVNNRIEI